MKMAAAAGNGDEQDRIEGSIAHDPADGIDSFSFRVTNCSSLLRRKFAHAAEHRTSKLRRRYGQRPKALKQHDNRKDNYRRNCKPALHVPKGMCVEVLACAMDPMQVFPAGRR